MTIFSRIIAGEIPCYKIAENDEFFAFLDINPIAKGHTLVVPKEEVDYIFAIDDAKLGVAVVGIEVPHAHIHLAPLNNVGDMSFEHKMTLPKEEMEDIAAKIRANVAL